MGRTERGREGQEIAGLPPWAVLFYRMLDAIKREFGTWDDEDIFEGEDQHAALMAIAELASSLLVPAACAKNDFYNCNWKKLNGVVVDEMWRRLREDDSDPPLPPPRRPKLVLLKQ